jgi:hypothetical protein
MGLAYLFSFWVGRARAQAVSWGLNWGWQGRRGLEVSGQFIRKLCCSSEHNSIVLARDTSMGMHTGRMMTLLLGGLRHLAWLSFSPETWVPF